MGREAPRERRAHLFAVVEDMTRERPQGDPDTQGAGIAHLLEIAKLSRASYYRWLEPKLAKRDDADLCDAIQRLALQRRHEGYRRLTKRLRDQGLVVNAKRVAQPYVAPNLLFTLWSRSRAVADKLILTRRSVLRSFIDAEATSDAVYRVNETQIV